MATEYLRRNLNVAKAVGAQANTEALLKRLLTQKNPPKWLVEGLKGIAERVGPLASDLVHYRDMASDNPYATTPPSASKETR